MTPTLLKAVAAPYRYAAGWFDTAILSRERRGSGGRDWRAGIISNWASVWCAHAGGGISMKSLACTFVIFLVMGFAAGQTDTKTKADLQADAHWFDYDSKQPLDIHDKVIENFDGGTLHDITYLSPKAGPVDAYLVVPTGKGPFAAILFGHWGNGTRAEFIPEAKIYARAGAVSLIPDYPWDRHPGTRHPIISTNRMSTARLKFRPSSI